MKLGSFDSSKTLPPATTGKPAAPATSGKRAAGTPQPGPSSTVALSPAAALRINQLKLNADFDAAKVARIAQAIRDGKFEIDAEAIADKLIGKTKELLVGRQH